MADRTVRITNKLNLLKKTVMARVNTSETPIPWSGNPLNPASAVITVPENNFLTVWIENGTSHQFEILGYVEFPAEAQFEFRGDHGDPGGPTPQVIATRSNTDTKITIQKGKADYTLELLFPLTEGGGAKGGEENVTIGEEQT